MFPPQNETGWFTVNNARNCHSRFPWRRKSFSSWNATTFPRMIHVFLTSKRLSESDGICGKCTMEKPEWIALSCVMSLCFEIGCTSLICHAFQLCLSHYIIHKAAAGCSNQGWLWKSRFKEPRCLWIPSARQTPSWMSTRPKRNKSNILPLVVMFIYIQFYNSQILNIPHDDNLK